MDPMTGKAELIRYHQMILASIATVKRGVESGQSV